MWGLKTERHVGGAKNDMPKKTILCEYSLNYGEADADQQKVRESTLKLG